MIKPTASHLSKIYPPRGPLQLHRFIASTAFRCFRCGDTKTSKLIGTYDQNWERRLCNGCYGRLLSIYEIKSNGQTEVQADALADALLAALSADDKRRAELLIQASDSRASMLTARSLRFVASSEFVASKLGGEPSLEWSPAVIGLCKAVETELIALLFRPLAEVGEPAELALDRGDKDIGRIANYCGDPTKKPPELGTIAHFLQTVAHSETRRADSVLINRLLALLAGWSDAAWVLNPSGLHHSLTRLAREFRNPAAHTDELTEQAYQACRDMVIGGDGILWRLQVARQPHR